MCPGKTSMCAPRACLSQILAPSPVRLASRCPDTRPSFASHTMPTFRAGNSCLLSLAVRTRCRGYTIRPVRSGADPTATCAAHRHLAESGTAPGRSASLRGGWTFAHAAFLPQASGPPLQRWIALSLAERLLRPQHLPQLPPRFKSHRRELTTSSLRLPKSASRKLSECTCCAQSWQSFAWHPAGWGQLKDWLTRGS